MSSDAPTFGGPFWSRLKTALLSTPLRIKILGMVLGLILLFAAAIIGMVQYFLDRNINTFLRQESRSMAGELSYQVRDYLLINDLYGLSRMLKNTVQNRPDLRYIVVVNPRQEVLSHTFEGGFPVGLLQAIAGHTPLAEETRRLRTSEGIVWETRMPIGDGSEGVVHVGVKGEGLRSQMSSLTAALAQATLFVAVCAVALSFLLTRLITKPLHEMLRATRAVMREDYSLTLRQDRSDELGRLSGAFNAMMAGLYQASQLRGEREQLRRDFLQRVIAGQEGERKRIARELHDQTGQALASFMVELKMLENAAGSEELHQGIQRLQRAITKEMASLHNLALELRPSVLDDLGLVPAVEMLVRDFNERHDIIAELTIIGCGDKRADPCTETCIYRIVQEALGNVVRHARAGRVTVLLEWRGEKIRGVIEDDGRGFEVSASGESGHLGILGMRERAQLLRGSFHLESGPEQGTIIVFEVPAVAEVCYEIT
ncbi:MAG: hypothetical protein BWK76_11235 [Desulfobulbaceae bacterium A2]|nr:MAG: hypothetical protein BWK76_11235 [Desulfobulbaceae bacterium A2]